MSNEQSHCGHTLWFDWGKKNNTWSSAFTFLESIINFHWNYTNTIQMSCKSIFHMLFSTRWLFWRIFIKTRIESMMLSFDHSSHTSASCTIANAPLYYVYREQLLFVDCHWLLLGVDTKVICNLAWFNSSRVCAKAYTLNCDP